MWYTFTAEDTLLGGIKMVRGDIKKINLSISSFERMITDNNLYVDKTKMIENFINTSSTVQLITRHRRLGKSLNMDMLKCFLTDKEDLRHLFKGLYIESSPEWSKVNSAPVFYFDFKSLHPDTYKSDVYYMVCDYIDIYCNEDNLSRAAKKYLNSDNYNDPKGLLYLTESVYRATGKRSYLLIDEYDKLLMENYNTDRYEELRAFETALLSAGLKGNQYLEKALLTGVMRISHESMLSGLNNIKTYDVFSDNVYTNDYGLTEDEMKCLSNMASFDTDKVRNWYNGVRISGYAIYNTYSVMSYLECTNYECYWGKSGTLDMIINLLNDQRKLIFTKLLNDETIEVEIDSRISLKRLIAENGNEAFFSLLVQSGYLALNEYNAVKGTALVSIPNRELMIVWKNFILSNLFNSVTEIRTLFDHSNNLDLFSKDIEYFLTDRLSYHDLATHKNENTGKVHERIYHVFLLGILSAYENIHFRHAQSNRESGDGRYDVLLERPEANYIFEVKPCTPDEDLESQATKALSQIETKRYGADLDKNKHLIKIGVAVCGKLCRVKCA